MFTYDYFWNANLRPLKPDWEPYIMLHALRKAWGTANRCFSLTELDRDHPRVICAIDREWTMQQAKITGMLNEVD